MRIGSVFSTELRVHPLVIVVMLGACVLGRLMGLLQTMLALTLHECAHALMARAFACRILTLELTPFGGIMRINGLRISPHAEWCVALTGPLTSIFLAGATALVMTALPRTGVRMEPFLRANLSVGLVNLLPALPLDGGRVLRQRLTGRLGTGRATRLTAWLGIGFGAALLMLTVLLFARGKRNPTLPVMGAFLVLTAARELRRSPERQLQAFFNRAGAFSDGVPVREIAARETMCAAEALRFLNGAGFTVLRVVDGDLRTVGELDEGRIIAGIVRYGREVTTGELLTRELS